MISAVYWYYDGTILVHYASGRSKKFDVKKTPARVWSFIRTHTKHDFEVFKMYI